MSQPSVLGRKWQILINDPTLSILERLLANRGVGDVDSQATYLNPELSKLHDPFLMDGMKGAVKHLQQAIKNNHRIIIFYLFKLI